MIGSIGWFAVPAVGIASFALLGILAIGAEVEDPFGSDTEWGTENDLVCIYLFLRIPGV